jgi:hypothetical protein
MAFSSLQSETGEIHHPRISALLQFPQPIFPAGSCALAKEIPRTFMAA